MPLAVSNLSLCFVVALMSILVVQLVELRDLVAETPDLFAKDFNVIRAYQNSESGPIKRSGLL